VAILGHASATDLGGASIGRSINFAALALGMGVAEAIEPLASQAVGAGDRRGAWEALVATLVATFLVWVPCAAMAYAATWLLAPIGIEAGLVEAARTFVLPQLPGMLFFIVFMAVKAFLQANEKTMPSVVGAILANIVNVIVCNLLVHRYGAFGAGLANTLANAILAGCVLTAAWKMRPERPFATLGNVRKVLRLGAPIGLQFLAEIGVFALVSVLAGRLGRVAVSAHQIALGLASFTFMGALGISGAAAVRVGHAIGEGRSPRRAGLVGIALGAAFMTVSAIVFVVIPRVLVSAFTIDAEVIELGASLLFVAAAFQLFDGVQVVATGALRGAADVRFAFLANIGAHWCVGLPLALWLGFHLELGARGLWIGLLAGLALVSVLLLGRFLAIAKGPVARV
jgi:MATE family multidrug resistance protein